MANMKNQNTNVGAIGEVIRHGYRHVCPSRKKRLCRADIKGKEDYEDAHTPISKQTFSLMGPQSRLRV